MTLFLKLLYRLGIITGILMIGVALGADFLFDGHDGFSTLQFLLLISGIVWLGICILLHQESAKKIIYKALIDNFWQTILSLIIIVSFTIILLELGLVLIGFKPHSLGSEEADREFFKPLPGWFCDDLGCRYDYEIMLETCDDEDYQKDRECHINTQGFYDNDEFVETDDDQYHILLLGDSFTWGYSSNMGNSWAELLESGTDDTLIWNTGIAGIGTRQQAILLQHFAPIQPSDLVILAFYPSNDFKDNMYPLDSIVRLATDTIVLRRYKFNKHLQPEPLSDAELAYYDRDLRPPTNDFEYLLRSTRVGSALSVIVDKIIYAVNKTLFDREPIDPVDTEAFWELSVQVTTRFLTRIKTYTDQENLQFLILLIPDRDDDSPSDYSRDTITAINIFRDLNIPYINPTEILDFSSDYDDRPGKHWNNNGHAKIADILITCVENMMRGMEISECNDLIVSPSMILDNQ